MTFGETYRVYTKTSEEIDVRLSVVFTITNNPYTTALVRATDQQRMNNWATAIAFNMGAYIQQEVRLWGLTLPGPRAVLDPESYHSLSASILEIRHPDFVILRAIPTGLFLTAPLPPPTPKALPPAPPQPKPPEPTWYEKKAAELKDFLDGLTVITDTMNEAKRTHPAFQKDPRMASAYEAQVNAQVRQSAEDYVASLRNFLVRKLPTWRNS